MSKKATEFLLGPKTRACYVHLMDKVMQWMDHVQVIMMKII